MFQNDQEDIIKTDEAVTVTHCYYYHYFLIIIEFNY